MSSASRILERLPSLYRPEPGYDDGDLLLEWALAVGAALDDLAQRSGEVMQAHWSGYADSAIYSTWLGRSRAIEGAPALTLDDPAIDAFPYLDDLPRIAGLVDLAPWREPLKDRDRVEAFRRRIRRIVRAHRDGLGTVRALRTMTMVALPEVAPEADDGLRERSFTIEEWSASTPCIEAMRGAGPPGDMVGPLMRTRIDSASLRGVTPMVVIEGVTSAPGDVDPTEDPIVERFDPATGRGLGIHYQGTLAPGQALALVSAHHSWLGSGSGIERSDHVPGGAEAVNTTAPGPWASDAGAPAGQVVDMARTADHFLWAGVNAAGGGSLWRYDGTSWQQALDALPTVRCLLARDDTLLVGFSTGLATLAIAPAGAFALSPDPGALTGPGVNALVLDRDARLWAATDDGLAKDNAGVLEMTALGASAPTHTALRALWTDASGDIVCGGDLGVFLHRPVHGRWFVLQGEAVDEAVNDWRPFDPEVDGLPEANDIFVPAVNALARDTGGTIWLGTEHGIARYRAREQRRTFTTLLEALPRLTTAAVRAIAPDPRGRLWFATDQGLFVHDQLDWFQRQGDTLMRLPRVDDLGDPPVFWRFNRGSGAWQSLKPPGGGGFVTDSTPSLATSEPALHAMAWTTSAVARLGSFDGTRFTVDTSATPAALAMRYKPEATRIVDGGIPGVPALAPGRSHWRYLRREEASPPTPSANPAWTREGRLLPPPSNAAAPFEGRYLAELMAPGASVFSYCPAARVWFVIFALAPLNVTVRLARAAPEEAIDPVVLDRVWRELARVKPAGVRVVLAVDEDIVRGRS